MILAKRPRSDAECGKRAPTSRLQTWPTVELRSQWFGHFRMLHPTPRARSMLPGIDRIVRYATQETTTTYDSYDRTRPQNITYRPRWRE